MIFYVIFKSYNKCSLPVMTVNYANFLPRLVKQFQCHTAKVGKTFEVIMLPIVLCPPKELAWMLRLNKVDRKSCIC